MIKRWKAQLRAWLIGAMRDAIRLERAMDEPAKTERAIYPGRLQPSPMMNVAVKPATVPIPDPSFEQMQAEAIQAQEKYYEPSREL